MAIIFREVNPHSCKTYLMGAEGAGEAIIVDPVLEHLNDYLKLFDKEGLKLTHTIDTHTHADHISGCPALVDHTDCEYVMHKIAPAQCVTHRVEDGAELEAAGLNIKFLHTPGHTQDSTCIIVDGRILTGDALFLDDGGAGRDDLPGGDPAAHWESLQRILELPEHLIVHPAHEYRDRQPSSLKVQKERNPHLKPRSKEEFIEYIEDLKLGPAEWMKDVLKANYACARDPNAAWIPTDVNACEVKGTLDFGVNDIQVPSLSAVELEKLLRSGELPVLLDVREDKELRGELGRLPGVVNIPITSLSGSLHELESDKDRKIVTVCRSGARAITAAQILTQAGFQKAVVLDGGMLAWKKAGYSAER